MEDINCVRIFSKVYGLALDSQAATFI